jgi:hypothetical protein
LRNHARFGVTALITRTDITISTVYDVATDAITAMLFLDKLHVASITYADHAAKYELLDGAAYLIPVTNSYELIAAVTGALLENTTPETEIVMHPDHDVVLTIEVPTIN